MRLEDMTIDELRLYKATVEVYGTISELVEVCRLIKKKEEHY